MVGSAVCGSLLCGMSIQIIIPRLIVDLRTLDAGKLLWSLSSRIQQPVTDREGIFGGFGRLDTCAHHRCHDYDLTVAVMVESSINKYLDICN